MKINSIKNNILKFKWLALIAAIFLVGCGKIEEVSDELVSGQVENQLSSNVSSSEEDNTPQIDQRFVPEISQVVADLKGRDDIMLGDEVEFKISESFTQTQNHFQLSVDQM